MATLTPFSLPFFATVYLIRSDKAPLTLIGIIAGAADSIDHGCSINICDHGYFLVIYQSTKKWLQNEVKLLPFHVFTFLLIGNLVEGYLFSGQFTLYELMMAGVESSLGFILTLIFLQASLLYYFKAQAVFKNRRNCLFDYFACFRDDGNDRVVDL